MLRILQWGEFTPIGSTKPEKSNARFIAASKRMLKDLIKKGKFRDDLFYRLNVLRLHVPPLRERKRDIPDLYKFFLEKYCKKIGKKQLAITRTVLAVVCVILLTTGTIILVNDKADLYIKTTHLVWPTTASRIGVTYSDFRFYTSI